MNNTFLSDLKLIDENISVQTTIQNTILQAAFLPYYIDPLSLQLVVLLKREIHPGGYIKNGKKMGLTVLKTELPENNPLTVEEAFEKLNIPAILQNAFPFGSIMIDPKNSSEMLELVLVQIDPPAFLDVDKGIVLQEIGEYEIGAIPFESILSAIQENFIQDVVTRMSLSELYILAVEETQKNKTSDGIIGSGQAIPNNENLEISKTSDIPDEILEMNAQKDFGSIYSR